MLYSSLIINFEPITPDISFLTLWTYANLFLFFPVPTPDPPGLQSRQYHLPFGAVSKPTQSK